MESWGGGSDFHVNRSLLAGVCPPPPPCSLCSPASTCCRIPKHSVPLLLSCSPSLTSQPLFTSALFPPSLPVWFDEWSRWTVSSTSSAGRGKSLLAVSHQSEFRGGGLTCFLSLSLLVVWRIRSQIRHNLAQKYIMRTPTAFRGRSRNRCKFHPCENGVNSLFLEGG